MALYNEILVGRYNKFLQKLLSMKGAPPAAQLAGEVTAALNLFSGVENRFLEGWDRFGYANTIAAQGVGNLGGNRMRNPASSNVMMVIEKISVSGDLTDRGVLQISPGLADLATIVGVSNQRLDSRGRPSPTAIMSTGIATSTGASIATANFITNDTYDYIAYENQEITLLPNDTLQILNSVTNQAFRVSIWWRERFLEESERQ